MAVCFVLIAAALHLDAYFVAVIAILWLVAVASATQDICVDGVYITSLDEEKQAAYIGLQGMAWNLGRIIAVSGTVWLAGWLQDEQQLTARQSWSVVMTATAGLLICLAIFHLRFLPPGSRPSKTSRRTARDVLAEFKAGALDFCDKPALWGMLSFVLFSAARKVCCWSRRLVFAGVSGGWRSSAKFAG